jgi:endopeptidase La
MVVFKKKKFSYIIYIMAGIFIQDFIIHNLQKEYKRFSSCIFNLENHINKCFINNIISLNDKNSYFKNINDLLKQLNNKYNNVMMNTCDNENEKYKKKTLSDIFPLANLSNINGDLYDEVKYLINLCKLMKIDTNNNENKELIEDFFNDPFKDINDELLSICKKIGFSNIHEGLNMIIGEHYDKIYDKDILDKINILKYIFICTGFDIIKLKKKKQPTIIITKTESFNESLINNCARINLIKVDDLNIDIIINGYFKYDSLNIMIRTSQICNNFIYLKKKKFEGLLNKRKDINDRFRKTYLRTCSFGDFLSLDNDSFLKQLDDDYNKYRKYIGSPFMTLMKEFVKDDIKNMFTIIKLLLMGSEENINVAGLLFGLTKDKKNGSEFVSNIIYKNLNHISQIKLRKAPINIKNEVDKIKSITIDDIDIKTQVAMAKNMPVNVKRSCLEKIEEMKSSNNEYHKQLLYVKTLLNYPWPSDEENVMFEDIGKDFNKSKDFLNNIYSKLDEKVYGHKNCKDTIQQIIAKWLVNPKSSGSAIGLVGPPGVGKTLIAKGLGDALGIPFVQIALGGQNDGELLHGHGYTYSGAQPGMVVKKMIESGSSRCIMYFDELDKACKKHDSNEIFNILIHITDPNMNGEFQDRFFQEIKFPLNKVIFVFSYNDSSKIDPILIDRITELKVKPYNLKDKIIISKNFLLKEICSMLSFDYNSVLINDDDIEFIIDEYSFEAGVRELKRKLEKIFLKLNIDRIYQKNIFKNINIKTKKNNKTIVIDRDRIIKYLNKSNVNLQEIHTEALVGVINGLYATSIGKGGIIPIQIYDNRTGGDEKFMLKLTGSQGKVMKESVLSAFTTAINYTNENKRNIFIKKNPYGFHVHTPSTSTPKDGPSAGCAFATAFISRILNKKIRNNIAMTGEIELTGKVTKIGGLIYKLIGAKKAGVNLVLVSDENRCDLEDIKKENSELLDENFKVKFVTYLIDVLKEALVDFDENDFNKEIITK